MAINAEGIHEIYATERGFEATLSGAKTFTLMTARLPPEPGETIHLFEVDSERSMVGTLKTGRRLTLRIDFVELVTCPWYACAVERLHLTDDFTNIN